MTKNVREREVETTNGLGHTAERGMENLKASISRRPELQGWLLLAAGSLLFIYAVRPEWLPFLNYVLIGIAIYLFLYGAYQAHLIERVTELVNWIRAKFSGGSKR